MLNKNYFTFINAFCLVLALAAAGSAEDDEDCELNAPNTMHHFCCDIHDENMEFRDCEVEWHDKIHATNEEQEMTLNFCISECVYNKTNYIGKDGLSLRMNIIKSHLEENGDDVGEELMLKTYEMCSKHAKSMLGHQKVRALTKRLAEHNCHTYPGLVFECVSNELILSCPSNMYHSSPQCDEAKSYLQVCAKHRKQ